MEKEYKMTRKEAIKRLKIFVKCLNCPEDKPCYDPNLGIKCKYSDCVVNVDLEEAIKIVTQALEHESTIDVLDKLRVEIFNEKDFAYGDFDQYKIDYLGIDARYVEDELPQDDFRYGLERALEIIDKYRRDIH